MIRILLIILSSISLCYSQVQVTGAFDQDTITIGNVTSFTLSVETSNNEEILAVSTVFLDSIYSALQTFKSNPNDTSGSTPPVIADFEILDMGQWQNLDDNTVFAGKELKWTTTTVGSKVLYENSFQFKFWDPGANIILIPPILIAVNGQQEQIYEGAQASIFIAPPLGVSDISQDSLEIEPIKPILTEAKNISDFLLYIYLIGGLLLIGIVYWLFKKWNGTAGAEDKVVEEIKVIIPAHKKALEALYNLRQKQLWQKGKIKAYQSKLTFIIRQYLEDRYEVPALESTTDEIIKNLSSAELDLSDIGSLKRILQVADLVKFAKAKPDESIHDSFMIEAEGFVKRTQSIDQNSTEDE